MASIKLFLKNYIENLSNSILDSEIKKIDLAASQIISTIKNKNNIFVCGNGGSAAIANHYVVDFIISWFESVVKLSFFKIEFPDTTLPSCFLILQVFFREQAFLFSF